MKKPVSFYSEGYRLVGDVYDPEDLAPGEKRAGIVLCHGYTGVNNPAAVTTTPREFIDETLEFAPEWVVDKIAPRPILFVTTDNDRLVPPEESVQLYTRAGEPRKLVVLKGYGHYEVYSEPAFSEVMGAALAWYRQYLPAR